MAIAPTEEVTPAKAQPTPGTKTDGGTIQSAWQGVQSILSKLTDTLNSLQTVTVISIATDLELITKNNNAKKNIVTGVQPLAKTDKSKPEGLVTEIEMLTGDIRHFRSKALQPPLEVKLEEVHAKHVELAQKIFQDNVRFVVDTVNRLRSSEQ